MNLKISYLDNLIDFSNNNVFSLEIENHQYFIRVVQDIYNAIYKDNHDNILLCDDKQEININRNIKVFINYFEFNVNYENYIKDINKIINQNIQKENIDEINTCYHKLYNIYKKIISYIDIEMSLNENVNLELLTKFMKISINEKNSILDNILNIFDIESILKSSKILIFINLKEYLENDELKELYKYATYKNINILLIDSKTYGTSIENENKLIIDSNLEEYLI